LGIKPGSDRGEQICTYLSAGGYAPRLEVLETWKQGGL
jgi:hypothetical protein